MAKKDPHIMDEFLQSMFDDLNDKFTEEEKIVRDNKMREKWPKISEEHFKQTCDRLTGTTLLRQMFRYVENNDFFVRYDLPQFGLNDADYALFVERAKTTVFYGEDNIYPGDDYFLELFSKPLKVSIWTKIKVFLLRNFKPNHFGIW